jgi:hypothetical protein
MALADESPEIGRDALDPVGPATPWSRLFPPRRSALGIRASSTPALAFILLGFVLGPHGLAVLTPAVIVRLSPVVSIALSALGIFVGLGIAASATAERTRMMTAALLEVLLTVAVVGGGLYFLLVRWEIATGIDAALFAAILGTCASASAAVRIAGSGAVARVARIADLDDLPLVVLGTIVVALSGSRPSGTGAVVMVIASVLAGGAGWLLFERARADAERGAFVAGTVILLGGLGAYTGMSPLLGGAVAALVWVWSPGRADRIIASDLRQLQHPLVALLLITAGASIQWQDELLWIAAPLVLLRHLGKLLASIAVAPMVAAPASLLATVLLPPGVLGVAVALNVQQHLDGRSALLVSSVTVAAAVAEMVSLALALPDTPEGSA